MSITTVLCAASVWLYVGPQLLFVGLVELGPLVGIMVMLPTLVGLIASLLGLLAGMVGLVRRRSDWPSSLMLLGQLLTWGLAVAIIVWAERYGTTGWELVALPASLMFGQLVAGAGLTAAAVRHRSAAVPAGGAPQPQAAVKRAAPREE